MYKRIKTRSDTSCWLENKIFALPIKSEKQKLAEAWYQDLLKFFKTLLKRSLGFIHILSCFKNQQLNKSN